jgi:hypothetical protein
MEPLPKNRSLLVVHALAAPSYSLGSPDFARPALAQTHVLAAPDFTLGSPDFGYSDGLRQTHRLEPRRRRTGRPPRIPTEAVREMLIREMEAWLRAEQVQTSHLPRPSERKVEARMMWLAGQAGVSASYHVLVEQVIRPALKKIRSGS